MLQMVRPSYDVNERRNRERSLFGLTDKRAPTPLKCVLAGLANVLYNSVFVHWQPLGDP